MISTTFAVVKYQRPKWSPWWDILRKIKNIYQGVLSLPIYCNCVIYFITNCKL